MLMHIGSKHCTSQVPLAQHCPSHTMPPKGSKKAEAKAKPAAKRQRTCAGSIPSEIADANSDLTLAIPFSKQFSRQVWKMRNLLNYRASDKCVKAYIICLMKYIHMWYNLAEATPEQKKAAELALAKYDLLTTVEDRQRFLDVFEENGRGHGKDSLKFVNNFQTSLTHTQTQQL